MIRVVEEHGPYIVIAPGFALAHARPDASVTRTGMSFLRLASPVAFGHESNDPVRLVMALAARDDETHRDALASLATVLSDPERRRQLDDAQSPQEVLEALRAPEPRPGTRTGTGTGTGTTVPAPTGSVAAQRPPAGEGRRTRTGSQPTVASKGLLLTVCGNGVGTSLFLKNTAEQVLDRWGWGPYLAVEATDTISAKGRAKEADFIMTSGAIPALDAPIVFPYAQNAVLIGFLSSFAGGLVALALLGTVLGPAFGLALVLPGLVPHFFTGGAAGVYGNATGGRRGAVLGAFTNGLLVTFLPALLLKVLGAFGSENTTFGDTDFGWFGILIGNGAKLGTVGGAVVLLAISAVILLGAIVFQRKVVDTGWDPAPARAAASGTLAGSGSSGSGPSQARTEQGVAAQEYPLIEPPAGAPLPPASLGE